MTLARGRNLIQQHETYLALKAGRIMRGWSQAQMGELMEDATGSDEWTEARITAVENGRKKISESDLRTFAEVQGYDIEFYWYGPPANRRILRDSGRANPGSVNPTLAATAELRDNRNHDPLHAPGAVCFDCLIDPDFHVLAEWLTPGGQIPGQVTIDLRDESLEKFLSDVA